jgi:hypothetical protein
MWTDYYLKAQTKEEFEASGFVGDYFDERMALVVVGEINGAYLANLRLREGVDVPDSLKPFLIDAPEHPARVFA